MSRLDQAEVTAAIVEAVPDAALVANLGTSAWNLAATEDRDRNYYLRGGMGVTTPVGLGLAMAIDDPVVTIEGDGSLLMSLGCLATVSHAAPSNFTVVVMNNERFQTTGGQPSLAGVVDFTGVARECGVHATHVETLTAFEAAFADAVEYEGPSVVVVDVTSSRPDEFPPLDYQHSFLKHRFRQALGVE